MDRILYDLVDLHQHLGFSSTPHFLWELAHEQGVRLDEKNYWKFINSITIKKTTSQQKYHHLFDITQKIQSGPYAVERAVHSAVSYGYRKANITTLELRFNPMRRNKAGEHDLDKIILAACVGLKKACLEYPVSAGLIIETDRRFNEEQNEILINKAISFKKLGVVGIDLSGPENKNFRINKLVKYYKKARDADLGLTFHTGETSSSLKMEEVILKIQPQRIGHGIKAVDNKRLMNMLEKKKIVLEICPSSNLALKIIENWEKLKEILNILQKNSVLFTINSDAPTLINTNVKNEFIKLLDKKILTIKEVIKCKQIAKKFSFIK